MYGECNCGTVSFELNREVSDIYICHCSICRKATGSSGIAVSIISKNKFHWLKGKNNISSWSKPGHDWETNFCSTCGSPLPGENDSENMFIPVSLLTTGNNKLKVAHHIYVGSKAGWEEIGDSGKQHIAGYNE
ncbi:GFA family protein [Aliikangiella sp. IMCC44359]|uniref:GFA family protein n=1 Tax=Aliikangiella sp. IMCC44359 TaxID=3459125 RepID=UPI00403AC272